MDNKIYSFSTQDAMDHGVDAAILLHNIRYWLDYARAHGEMEQDGYHWMFMSANKMQSIMPFWTSNKIQKMLKSLTEKGVLIAGEYNNSSWNRTKWYTMPEFAHSAKRRNGVSETADSTFSETADSLYSNIEDSNTGKQQQIDYEAVTEVYNKSLTKIGNIAKMTKTRKGLVKKFFDEFGLTVDTFENYLSYINNHPDCQWMFEKRPMNDGTGRNWAPLKFEYFISEKCYLNVKENL